LPIPFQAPFNFYKIAMTDRVRAILHGAGNLIGASPP
jgi:hypothetical protein